MDQIFQRSFLTLFIFLACSAGLKLNAQIKGQVLDAKSREPLKGANVELAVSHIGEITDQDGFFSIEFTPVNTNDTLLVSFLGYEEYIIPVSKYENNSVILLKPVSLEYADSVVVKAEYIDLPKKEIPHASEQLTLREIENYGTGEIADLFKSFSSIRVEGNDLDGRSIQIRGSSASEVNVYVDGVLINNLGLDNSADLTILPTESIEKLEVLKGGNLTLLGKGAFGGVVNITTKKRFNRSIGFQAKLGSFDSKYFLGEVNLPVNSKFYVNYFGQFNSFFPQIEYFPDELFSERTENNNIETTKQNHNVNLNYFFKNGQFNTKFIGYFFDYQKPAWENSRKNYLISSSYKGSLLHLNDFEVSGSYFTSKDNLVRSAAGSAQFISDFNTKRLNLKLLKKFYLNQKIELHVLSEYYHDELEDVQNVKDVNFQQSLFEASLWENRASIGGIFSFADQLQNSSNVSWKTHLGFRGDFVSNGNKDFLSTIGAQADINKGDWKLSPYVNYGKNVKYPTLFDNAYIQSTQEINVADTVFRRINPEYNNSAEIGLDFMLSRSTFLYKNLSAHLALFSNTVYNKILGRPFDFLVFYYQRGRNVTKGLEASVKFNQVLNWFGLKLDYTGLDISDPLFYPFKPDQNFSTQLDFNLPMGFYFTGRYFYEGKSIAWYLNQEGSIQTQSIQGYNDVDVSIGYRLNISNIELALQTAGYNLLDSSGFQYYYLSKRYLQVALSIKYN